METKESVEMTYESPVITEAAATDGDNKAAVNICDSRCFFAE
ncbi:MAG: hypothetical protein AAB359_09080 [Elusimicrobiota bacterium]